MEDETTLYNDIIARYNFAKKYLDTMHIRFNEQEELYRNYIDPATTPNKARVFDPRVFRVVETITPRMVVNEPMGSFYPRERGDEATIEIFNQLIKFDWQRAKMLPKLVLFAKSLLLFGTAFGRCYWDNRTRDKKRMIAKEINGQLTWTPTNSETIKETVYDGPNFETLNIYDCFPDPNATNLENMRWFIYRTYKTLKELENENDTKGGKLYKNLDKLREAMESKMNNAGSSFATDTQYREHRRTMLSTQDYHGQDPSAKECVVLICYERDHWVTIVQDYGIVIRDTPNLYFHGELPIVYGVDYPYPGELFGMGEIEPVDRVQRAINAVLNQRLDNVQLVLNNMWKVRKGAGVDMHTLVSTPGNVITTNDMAGVEMFNTPDVTGATFVGTMSYLTSALQNGSGITDYTTGVNDSSNTVNQTATGVRLIQQEANAQFKLKVQLFNDMVVKEIANQWKELRVQYTTEEQVIRIVGRDQIQKIVDSGLGLRGLDGEQVAPGDDTETRLRLGANGGFAFLSINPSDIQPSIVGDYDFIPVVSTEQISDPMALQSNFFVALDKVNTPIWTQGLAQAGKRINYEKLTEKIFTKLNLGLEGADVIENIPQPEPIINGQNGEEAGGVAEGAGFVPSGNLGEGSGMGGINPPEGLDINSELLR